MKYKILAVVIQYLLSVRIPSLTYWPVEALPLVSIASQGQACQALDMQEVILVTIYYYLVLSS